MPNAVVVKEDEDSVDNVPSASLSASFLESNAQSHRNPMWAWGDIVDNSREAEATFLKISHVFASCSAPAHILLVDDGCGMNERMMKEGVLGLAYTKKDATATGQVLTTCN